MKKNEIKFLGKVDLLDNAAKSKKNTPKFVSIRKFRKNGPAIFCQYFILTFY